jgi:hypothetical protein
MVVPFNVYLANIQRIAKNSSRKLTWVQDTAIHMHVVLNTCKGWLGQLLQQCVGGSRECYGGQTTGTKSVDGMERTETSHIGQSWLDS